MGYEVRRTEHCGRKFPDSITQYILISAGDATTNRDGSKCSSLESCVPVAFAHQYNFTRCSRMRPSACSRSTVSHGQMAGYGRVRRFRSLTGQEVQFPTGSVQFQITLSLTITCTAGQARTPVRPC